MSGNFLGIFDFGGQKGSAPKPKAGQDKKQKSKETEKTVVSPWPAVPTKNELLKSTQEDKKLAQQRLGAELEIKRFYLSILHDSTIPKEKLDLVRKVILSLYPRVVEYKDDMTIIFIPADFAKKEKKWW